MLLLLEFNRDKLTAKRLKTKMTSGSKLVQNFALTGNEIHILSHFPADEQEIFKVDIQKFKQII